MAIAMAMEEEAPTTARLSGLEMKEKEWEGWWTDIGKRWKDGELMGLTVMR